MTYIPYTLEGKFVDRETGRDLTMYMDIAVLWYTSLFENEQVIQDSFEYKCLEIHKTDMDIISMRSLITKYRFCRKTNGSGAEARASAKGF